MSKKVAVYKISDVKPDGQIKLVKLDKEIRDSGCVNNFQTCTIEQPNLILWGESLQSDTIARDIIRDHVAVDELTQIQVAYTKHRQGGEAYFDSVRADLVLCFNRGEKTASEIFEIEDKLDGVITKLIRGDWMTAAAEMQNVVIGGALDQELYDKIENDINFYISENY